MTHSHRLVGDDHLVQTVDADDQLAWAVTDDDPVVDDDPLTQCDY